MANDFKRGIRVYLETSDYGKGIDAMVASTKKYEAELSRLTEESKKMTAAGIKSGKALQDNEHQQKKLQVQIAKSKNAEADYRAKLQQTEKVLNNLSGHSYNELIKVQKQLQKELKETTRGTELHKVKLDQLNRVNTEVSKAHAEMNTSIGATPGFLKRMTNGFNQVFYAIIPFVAVMSAVAMAIKKFIDQTAKMEDAYADVSKTTNLTREEVVKLNDEFKKMDTRTTRESLNLLARDAGKLGIEGSKNILDFVDAGNQINVALGEDLGADAVKSIGKMVGVYDTATKQLQNIGLKEQMLAVGSAVNSIGQSSSAAESYLVDFSGRLGGVSKQAKISLADILGFASALDQDMQHVEMAATSFQGFITKLMMDPAKFAKLAGLEVKGFTDLLKTDTNAAIKQVLRSLNEKGGFAALIPIFEDMNLDGSRAIGVLSSMAGSIDKIDEAQKLANISMAEGTSVTKEYNVKNNNFAAQLEKSGKKLKELGLSLGTALIPLVTKAAGGMETFVDVLMKLPKWLYENKGLLISLAVVWGVNTTAIYASIIADKLKVFWTDKVIVSLKTLWTTIKANPWGLIATGAILAIAWLNNYLNKQKEVNVEQQKFNDLVEKSKELMEDTKSIEERAKIIDRMSKSQLESFQGDLESQIAALDQFDVLIRSKAEKEMTTDAELLKLKARHTNAKTELERQALLAPIKWREDALLKQLGKEYSTNQTSLRNLRNYLKNVQTILKTKPDNTTTTDTTGGGGEKTKSDPYKLALDARETAYKESQLNLKKRYQEQKISEEMMNMSLLGVELQFQKDKKAIQEQFGQETVDTEISISDTRLKIQETYDKNMVGAAKLAYEASKQATDALENAERERILKNFTTKEDQEMSLAALEVTVAQKRLADARMYGEMIADETFARQDDKVKAVEDANAEILKAEENLTKAQKTEAEKKYDEEKKYQEKRQALIDKYGLAGNESLSAQYRKDLTELQKSLRDKLLTQEEYEKAVKKLQLKKITGFAETAVELAGKVSDAVTAYHQAETDSLEAEKQKQLTIAGDDATKREAVEKEFAQKELDLKKKQAGANAAIQIAQAFTAGALGVANIWGVHAANPVLAGILTALEVATVGAEIASIMKQRDAIMATTLNSTGDSSSGKTGARVITAPQAADGRWDVMGQTDGRVYRNVPYRGVARNGIVSTPTLYGERGDELVVDNPTLRNIRMNAPYVLDTIMRHKVPQRADGNYNSMKSTDSTGGTTGWNDNKILLTANLQATNQLIGLVLDLQKNGVDAFVLLSELEKKQALRNKSLKKGSLK